MEAKNLGRPDTQATNLPEMKYFCATRAVGTGAVKVQYG